MSLWRRPRRNTEADAAVEAAQRRLEESRELRVEFAREGAKSRQLKRQNHFGDSIAALYEGKN